MNNVSIPAFVCKRSGFAIISVSGENVSTFLQGQLTSDVNALNNKQFQFSAYLDRKGRVISSFLLLKQDQHTFWLILPESNVEKSLKPLKMYGAFSKVSFEDISSQYSILGTYNLKHQLLAEILDFQYCAQNAISTTERFQYLNINVNKDQAWFICTQEYANEVYTKIFNLDVDEQSYELQDILQGLAFITANNSGQHLAHSLNLPKLGAVSFTKGCFLGQEIVARMEHKGTPKQGLYQVVLNLPTADTIPPSPGSKIVNAEKNTVGEMFSIVKYNDQAFGLAVMYHEFTKNPSQLFECEGGWLKIIT